MSFDAPLFDKQPSTSLALQLLNHLALVNINDERMIVFANDGADAIHVGEERTRFIGRGGEQNLQPRFAHEVQGRCGAGGVHFAEGLIEKGKADGVGWARLIEAIGLRKRSRHCHIKWRGGFAARFLGVDLTQ